MSSMERRGKDSSSSTELHSAPTKRTRLPSRFLLLLVAIFTVKSSHFNPILGVSATSIADPALHRRAPAPSPTLADSNASVASIGERVKRATVTGHAQLAAASGMKSAAVPSLPFPTSALTTTDSMNWIKNNWNWTSGTSDFVNFVVDPFGSGKIVLRVRYPKGSYSHDVAGGAGFYLDVLGGATPLRALLSYQVAFSNNFDFVKGGKLPGLYGGDHAGGCSGGANSDLCFSLRVLWRAQGAGEIYAYLPGTTPAFCASSLVTCNDAGYGTSLGRSTWNHTSSIGAWSTVVESAVLNSDPSISGAGTARANGYISTYFNPSGENAKLAFTKKGIVFRTKEVGFSKLFFSTFFGGGTVDYASTKDVYAYFKDFNIYQGTGDSNASGDVVTVS